MRLFAPYSNRELQSPELLNSAGFGHGSSRLADRRYIRVVAPGVISGFIASLIEWPSFILVGLRTSAPFKDVALAAFTASTTFCALGIFGGLLFEVVFHVILGIAPPAPVSDSSQIASESRRKAVAHLGVSAVSIVGLAYTVGWLRPHTQYLFGTNMASVLCLTLLSTIPWMLCYAFLYRLAGRLLDKSRRLRQIFAIASLLLYSLSWVALYRLFTGVSYILRSILVIQTGFLFFAVLWFYPRKYFNKIGALLSIITLLSLLLLVRPGIPGQVRLLLCQSHGAIETLILQMPISKRSASIDLLRSALSSARNHQNRLNYAQFSLERLPKTGETVPHPDVILITVDSLRPDRLRSYNAKISRMPNLDRFSLNTSVFLNAFSTAPGTNWSLTQMLAGRFEHQIPHLPIFPIETVIIRPDTASIASMLRDIGYFTKAQLGVDLLPVIPFLGQGFHSVVGASEDGQQRRAQAVLDSVLMDIAKAREQPLFIWAHLMDVHTWQRKLIDNRNGESQYDYAVTLVDQALGGFLEALNQTSRGRAALVIITADHGEALGESGRFYHGFMSPSTLRIPLLIRFPDAIPRTMFEIASLIDLTPTILDVLGLPIKGLPGRSLRPFVDGRIVGEEARHPIYHESQLPTTMLETGITLLPWQLIYNYRYDTLALYNLTEDPSGSRNLAGEELQIETRLIRLLTEYYSNGFSQSSLPLGQQ